MEIVQTTLNGDIVTVEIDEHKLNTVFVSLTSDQENIKILRAFEILENMPVDKIVQIESFEGGLFECNLYNLPLGIAFKTIKIKNLTYESNIFYTITYQIIT